MPCIGAVNHLVIRQCHVHVHVHNYNDIEYQVPIEEALLSLSTLSVSLQAHCIMICLRDDLYLTSLSVIQLYVIGDNTTVIVHYTTV